MRKILNRIFKLPPVERRSGHFNFLMVKYFDIPTSSVREKDDIYIYSQAIYYFSLICLSIFFVYFVAFLLQRNINFYLFTVLGEGNLYESIEDLYQKLFPLFWGTYFFFILKFRWNLNPRTYDITWFQPQYKYQYRIDTTLSILGALLIIALLLKYMGVLIRGYIFGVFYSETFFSYLIYLFLTGFIYIIGMLFFLIGTTSIWRHAFQPSDKHKKLK